VLNGKPDSGPEQFRRHDPALVEIFEDWVALIRLGLANQPDIFNVALQPVSLTGSDTRSQMVALQYGIRLRGVVVKISLPASALGQIPQPGLAQVIGKR